jgi:glutathione S-transferase
LHRLPFSPVSETCRFGIPTNEENAKKQKDTLAKKLEGYERILSKSKYLGGENLTVADLSHLAYGALLSNVSTVSVNRANGAM